MKKKDEVAYSRALVPKYNTIYKIIIFILIVIIIILVGIYLGFIKLNNSTNNEENSEPTETGVDVNELIFNDNIDEFKIGKTQMKIDYIDNCTYTVSYPEIGIEEIDEEIKKYARELKNAFIETYRNPNDSENTFSENVDYRSSIESGDKFNLVLIDVIVKNATETLSKHEYTHVFDLNSGIEINKVKNEVNEVDNIEIAKTELVPLESTVNEDVKIIFSGDIIKYAIANVNIRKEKSTNSPKLDLLYDGEAIEVHESDDEWETVVYKGELAYVKAGYLSRRKLLHKDIDIEIVDRGIDPSKPMVALTYDDGPNPISTPRILDTLEKYGVVATFFDLGQLVNTYPDIVRREEHIGCEVGSHTYSHKNLNTLTDEQIQTEIKKSELAFEKALGHNVKLLRPPYGNANLKVKENVEYPLIKWNVDSLDWKSRNKDKILKQIRQRVNYDGDIILMHSIYGSTADATEVLVPELIEQGYQLVTVSELAFYRGNSVLKTGMDYTDFRRK